MRRTSRRWGSNLTPFDTTSRTPGGRATRPISSAPSGSNERSTSQGADHPDYVFFPALRRSCWRKTLAANATANLLRNLWAYVVIFCGHFPDGAEKFTADVLEHETRTEWYLRQMLGSANFKAGRLLAFSSGNLCYQIEHHLFPDLPSNRYAQIAVRVRALCEKYDLPYTTGPLWRQYGQALRTILKLSLPNGFTTSDQPEPTGPVVERGRRLDGERPTRRTETGAWTRASA